MPTRNLMLDYSRRFAGGLVMFVHTAAACTVIALLAAVIIINKLAD